MIAPSAISAFLNRKLENYDWVKELKQSEIDQALRDLKPRPDFITKPMKHQLQCFLLGANLNSFCFFLDMGTGKSKLALDLMRWRYNAEKIDYILIVTLYKTSIEGWMEQLDTHAPDLPAFPLIGSSEARWRVIERQKYGAYIINFPGLVALCSHKVRKKGKNRMMLSPKKVGMLRSMFDAIILDESQQVSNPKSLTYKVCKQISLGCRYRYLLTGTPMGRDAQDLWAQFNIADRGETLGPTMTLFREAFFSKKFNPFGGAKYKLEKKKKPLLMKTLKNRSIWYDESECGDLPPVVRQDIVVAFPKELQTYYQDVLTQLRQARKNYTVVQNAFVLMRQITSGFMGMTDDESGDKVKLEFDHNPKMEALLGLAEGLPAGRKMVVFHEYVWTGERIYEELGELGFGVARINGAIKNPSAEKKWFDSDPKCRFMVLNNHSGSATLNLQVANYQVFFESPVSPKDRRQAEKRCWRTGQKRRTFIYDLIMRKSVDVRIRQFLEEGESLFEAVISGKMKL